MRSGEREWESVKKKIESERKLNEFHINKIFNGFCMNINRVITCTIIALSQLYIFGGWVISKI